MSARRRTTGLLTAGLLAAAVAALAAPTPAQAQDARWMPFVGCWAPSGQVQQDGMLCFRLADDGVEVLSVAEGEITATEILVADGRPRTLSQEGCEGSESARFSDDGRRVYTDTEMVCEGGVARDGSGIMSFTSPARWLDVRSAEVDGQKVAWIQFYEAVPADRVVALGLDDPARGRAMAVRSARIAASRPLKTDDVVDAVRHVDVKAVEAWIAERGEMFRLDAETVVALADGGVPESVIDVLVAVSNPGTFTVDRQGDASVAPRERTASGWRGYPRAYASPLYGDPFYLGYYRYGYGSRFSPFGYYGGYYGGYGYYTPTTVTVDRRDDRPRGRVVKGRGYTRGSSAGSSGRSYPSGRATTGRSSGSSSVGASSRGSSSGRSTGRKAKRRGGGGNGGR